ncbi:DUF397 domain-containing protein [Streptomyces sp. NPDC058254]|uniref:DUF397 domain-containing protein n=1 Tax=Streptomyces sp. NPDC058254 TaxID=3346406 RepID=UPI0036EA262D
MSTALRWFKSSYSGSEGGDCIEVAFDWRKSSYSSEQGGACLEAAYEWSKSTYSGSEGGNCLEVSPAPTAIHIRDSKTVTADSDGPMFRVAPAAWAAFLPLARR